VAQRAGRSDQVATIQVSVINASNRAVTDAELASAVPILQKQVRRDFAPIWGIDADVALVGPGQMPPSGSWWLVILDNSDQAGALGYHDLTSEGLPLGKVFAGTDKQFGYKWTVTASHELLEMLGDPDINLTVFSQATATEGVLVAYEVCDPCEDDVYGYDIDGVTVSDFVYPTWFESFRTGDTQFDQQKQIHKPFGILSGGYISEFDVRAGAGWHQVASRGAGLCFQHRPRLGSRRERRRLARDHWQRSNPK
jgi:hypothetical protein